MAIRKRDRIVLCAVTVLAVFAVPCAADGSSADYSGSCGEGIEWYFNEGGETLYIAGTGAMKDYGDREAPWYPYWDNIKHVVLKDGITHIGDYAFYGLRNVGSASIPGTVESIGRFAFGGCRPMTSVTIPGSVTSIGDHAFVECGLTSVRIPDSVTVINASTFSLCYDLESVIIPDSVVSIGKRAFCQCKSLTSVTIPGSVTEMGAQVFMGSAVMKVYNRSDLDIRPGMYGLDNKGVRIYGRGLRRGAGHGP